MVFGLLFWIVGNIFALAFEQDDPLAQQVEHIPFKDGVLGSNPKRITEKSFVGFQRGIFFVFLSSGLFLQPQSYS